MLVEEECFKFFFQTFQGYGAGTQISGFNSGHQSFLTLSPTIRSFWLGLQNSLVQKTEKKHCIICITGFPTNYLCETATQNSGSDSTI